MSTKTFLHPTQNLFFWQKVRIPLFVLLMILFTELISGQAIDCGSGIISDVPDQGIGNCIENLDNLSPICVKLKIHVINNNPIGTQDMDIPDDALVALVEYVNSLFSTTKIRFSMGNNCIHRAKLRDITTDFNFRQLWGPNVSIGQFTPDAALDWDLEAINIFFFQNSIFNLPYSALNLSYPVVYLGEFLNAKDSHISAHELGHALSLMHTFGPGNGALTQKVYWECKDGSNSATTGDNITDTGADPLTQDLVPPFDNIPDTRLSCYQQLPNSYKDYCEDDITPWNIPFDNVMSYYKCGSEFTPCQSVAMHNRVTNITSHLKMNCSDDLFNSPPCADIIISQETTWVNQVINMCPNQRIIINPPGKLIIDHCTITKGNRPPPNPNCPTLINNGNWDGIYVGNISFPIPGAISGLIFGPIPGNILTIKSGSVIEYSNNGIVTGGTFGNIIIQSSTFQHNGRIAKAIGSGNISFYNSTLNVDPFTTPFGTPVTFKQIEAIGSNIYFGSLTKLENFGLPNITGINSTNGKVGIIGSTIKNFEYSIYKDLGGNLEVFGSKFYGAPLYNKSNSIRVRKSYFEKIVTSEGNTIGTYSGNHFKGDLYLYSPQQSNVVTENYFTSCYFGLDKNNKFSDAICNRWNNELAVDASATALPISWGTQLEPSGNKWEGTVRPGMYSVGINITNFHKFGDNLHRFTYGLPFNGANSNLDAELNCQYPTPPTGLGNGGTTGVGEDGQPLVPEDPTDWTSLNTQYIQIIALISNLESNLPNTSGEQLLALQDNIENQKITAGQIINEAIQNLTEEGDQYLAALWLSRAGYFSSLYQTILTAIYNSEWSTASTISTILNDDSSEVVEDKSNFIAAINYLNNLAINDTPIHKLNETQLDSLIDLCDNSFGDYTAPLRTFLNIQYGILLTAPKTFIQRSKKEENNIEMGESIEIAISPNPNNGRFTLVTPSQLQLSEFSVTDVNGTKVYSSKSVTKLIELPAFISHGVYILNYKFFGEEKSYSKKLIIIR